MIWTIVGTRVDRDNNLRGAIMENLFQKIKLLLDQVIYIFMMYQHRYFYHLRISLLMKIEILLYSFGISDFKS